ncbi:MAG: glutamate 5-kinase [Bdellovibrionales bacterium]|nr:glutamate 5-kinase [Bdellovibrionales bacterium]
MAKSARRWVVKAGSQMVCSGGPLLLRAWMQQVAQLRKQHGIDVIWVTSGAIAWAAEHTGFKNGAKRTLPQKQALSAVGQPLVMDQYNLALHATKLIGSQVLLTAGDMRDPVRRRNLQNTLKQLIAWQVIPILNENDAVATEEIRFGDNDSLASQVAVMMKAERLVLLTDVDGLYDADPKKHRHAQLISYRASLAKKDLDLARGKSVSKMGTGGMYSKLLAAQKASREGIVTHLVRGDIPGHLLTLAEGGSVGTQVGGRPSKRA